MSKFELGFYDPFYEDWDDLFRFPKETNHKSHLMRTDVKENEKTYQLDIELPGVKKEDVDLSLRDGYLTISYEHKNEKETKEEGRYVRRERFYGSLSRSFYVGENVSEEDISASLENGVLTIEIPKESKVNREVKKISIK